jgi:putative ABC transport system permease protein
MSLWSRFANVFRSDRLNRELDDEMQSHLDEAVEQGRDAQEARRAFGSELRTREQSRDLRVIVWLDSLRADLVFGWRQIVKHKTPSAAAILSLGLAIGASTAAFRLIDALFLRSLPVSDPSRLYCVTYEYRTDTGRLDSAESLDYPSFRVLRSAVKDSAEMMAISHVGRIDVTYGSGLDTEKVYRQWVSGWTFSTLGLRPAVGRLLHAADDTTKGAHPYAVISHDYWMRRFAGDPNVVGRSFRTGNQFFEIVGVLETGFTGTETGTFTDIFTPMMMNPDSIDEPARRWFRAWVQLRPDADRELVRQRLEAAFHAERRERAKTWAASTPRERIQQYVNAPLQLEQAAAGVSGMQKTYRRSLSILAVMVGLVLLIACANVANLMTAQAASRQREMALRVSIGAGRGRLIQLLLVECTMIALFASVTGAFFASWAAPLVVSLINPPANPARLILTADWRVLGFSAALALAVALLFGIAPALRASGIKPVSALKGGENPHARRRLMNVLVAAQMAFCFLVHLAAGLFVSTFERLSHQPVGFSPERLLVVDAVANADQPAYWDQVVEHLRSMNGVESAALCGWPLMSGTGRNKEIWANGRSPGNDPAPYLLGVSPGWIQTMKIPLLAGRDLRPEDADPGSAIVNEAFARRYFDGQNPVGRSFERMEGGSRRVVSVIVGYVSDARYYDMREPVRPTAYVPFAVADESRQQRTFMVRTRAADPMALAPLLRKEIPRARSEFLVSNVFTQQELIEKHTLRERLLALLSMFFAAVALLLAAVGLYGVLDYSVVQRRREIGIRLALGAQAGGIVRRVTAEVFTMLAFGAAAALALGVASERYIKTLLFEVKATDWTMLAVPVVTMAVAALLAALPPVLRAVRTDPTLMLRME